MNALATDALPYLRDMHEDDMPEIMAIERAAYPFPWTEGIMRDCFKFGYTCKVYESRDGIIGYGIVSIAAGECHFLNICIAPVHQQQGHGARLVAHPGIERGGCRVESDAGAIDARIATRWATPGKRLAKIAGTTVLRTGKLLSA